jgi:uncharacterized protein YqjF (DUF2071 family)
MLKHPIAMRTVFRRCFLANFAVRPDFFRGLLPSSVEPDLHEGEAYVSAVIADMENMRPAFLPPLLGVTYSQVVYRAVVRRGSERGVFFLRSDADNPAMCVFGNWLTFFRFHRARVDWSMKDGRIGLDLASEGGVADIHAAYNVAAATRALPGDSRFASLDEAQSFLVELYCAFARDSAGRDCCVRIERGPWNVVVVNDTRADYRFFQTGGPLGGAGARLDSVFYVEDLPYHWYTLERSAPSRTPESARARAASV